MFLKIKNIPSVYWSSDKPLNLKPKISTFFFLCFGLTLFGLGEGLLIVSASGASPWSVFAQGLYLNLGFSIGVISIFISFIVLMFWFPLKQKIGIGTVLNALIIGLMIDVCIRYIATPESYINQILLGVVAVVTVGLGGGIYLVANLGAGPRDGLMIGLQQKTNLPIASVRGVLEISIMSIGWYLGGTVGVGTFLFAFGIGPCVALGLFLVDKLFN
jgi:uncharacterized protein